ncbi:MAG: FtsX-like permease family protein [Dehalococcoidales bacterium]
MLSLKIAVRFLKTGGAQNILIIIGIAIAISIQLFVGLLIDSLQKTLISRTIGNSPHITVVSSTDVSTIREWEKLVREMGDISQIKTIAVSATTNAFIEDGNRKLPVIVRGFNFAGVDSIYNISDSLYEGKPYKSSSEILIGKNLRETLEVDVGDKLVVKTPDGKDYIFTISGFYDLGVAAINDSWILANLETTQRVFDYGNRITSIEATVNDVFAADATAHEVEQILENKDIEVQNWKEQNEELFSGLEGQRISSIIIQVVIIASVVIAISSVLAITVLQKSKEIGILKAMGIKDLAASLIFIYEGFLIGLIGATLGVILGLGLLYGFNASTTSSSGVATVDLYIEYDFIIRSWLIGVTASTIAGILPARKSLKLSPVEVIREG